MYTGGKKVIKPQKTKPKKYDEQDYVQLKQKKNKHHDKSFYRLVREEKEYVV